MQESWLDQSSLDIIFLCHKMPRELTTRIKDVMAIFTYRSQWPCQDSPAKVAYANVDTTIHNFSESHPRLQDHADSRILRYVSLAAKP